MQLEEPFVLLYPCRYRGPREGESPEFASFVSLNAISSLRSPGNDVRLFLNLTLRTFLKV